MTSNNSWNSQNPAQVAMGCTGITTATAYAPICGGTTATGAFQAADTGLSTVGYILTSNGNAAVPSFQAPPVTGFIQCQYTESNTEITVNATMPYDNTIPQKTEGVEILTCTITPTHADNILVIKSNISATTDAGSYFTIALFQDDTDGALAATEAPYCGGANWDTMGALFYAKVAGTTSATTFKIRCGAIAGASIYVPKAAFGGVQAAYMEVMEVTP